MKRVILITGTPCVGKTTIARQLASKLDAFYINLTEFAEKHHLIAGEDEKRGTCIIAEEKMRLKIAEEIKAAEKAAIVIDGHYAYAVVPKRYVTRIFVLRRNPIELRKLMEQRGFAGDKLWENLAAEILDVCLVEALQAHRQEKICELDVTGKTAEEAANEILAILDGREQCLVGVVDWLGMLEKEKLVEEYLKI
ncbi:MAG: adenylate kinase family protein [Candidatus Bathyarchaeota archaeon]|nr:adenylate kinase family protein [Candidatus Bathyarchaeota archaeon]